MPSLAPDQVKSCCATFYQEPLLRALVGGVLHPGGLRTTADLARRMNLRTNETLLDVACGPGQSARYLAETVGCRVMAIDYGVQSVTAAREIGGGRVHFVAGDAERLPFVDCRFDAVVVECSLCLFPDKPAAVGEMHRILKPGGSVGIADIALERPLPSEVHGLTAWTACLAGACTTAEYCRLLKVAGFSDVSVEDASWALEALVYKLSRWLFLLDVASGLRKTLVLPVSPNQARDWLGEARRWIADGSAKYLLLTGRRPY